MITGFLLSRTVGLPGFNESGVWAHWTEGFPALAAELGFLALAIKPILAPAAPGVSGTALADPIARDRVLSSR
jgi:hypothetical protein